MEIPEQEVNQAKFCTACGDKLEDFCFSPASRNVDQIRKVFVRCKKRGRFTGDFCSLLFIAETGDTITTNPD